MKKLLLLLPLIFNCASQLKHIDNLVVNKDNSHRTVIEKSEKKGVEDIRKIINNDDGQEAWVYLPKKQRWIELGTNKRDYNMFDTEYLRRLMNTNKELVVYYLHNYTEILDSLERSKSITEEERPDMIRFLKTNESIPGKEMLMLMIYSTLESHSLKCSMIYKLCSRNGVTEFSLTDAGRDLFSELIEHDIFLKRKSAPSLKRVVNDTYGRLSLCDSTKGIIPCIEQICNEFTNYSMKVEFKPYK